MRRPSLAALALTLAAVPAHQATAQYIRTGFADTPMTRGDDNISASQLGFRVNYYGVTTTAGVVCTNGYVIMGNFAPSGGVCAYPGNLSANPPAAPNLINLRSFYGSLLAPFFSDMRTDFAGNPGNPIELGTGMTHGREVWAATWDGVRGYPGGTGTTGATSTFQVVLASLGGGDFVMEYNYGALGWAAEGGIGFTDDGGATGTPILAQFTNTRPANSRYCARFEDGVVVDQAFDAGCQAAAFTAAPEPTTVTLVAAGLIGLVATAARRRRDA